MANIEITVGGQPRTLARLRSYKVTLALDVLSDVTDQVRGLMKVVAEARERYAEENKVRITRAMCMDRAGEFRALADALQEQAANAEEFELVSRLEIEASQARRRAESWERQLDDMGDKDYVEFPDSMTEQEAMLVAIPEAMKMRRQFAQAIGLALIPDTELKGAWRSDTVGDTLFEYGMGLLEELEFGEEVALVAALYDLTQDQIRPHQAAFQKLRKVRQWWTVTAETQTEEEPEAEENGEQPKELSNRPSPDVGTPTSSSPPSSTPSPTDTDGTPSESSLTSRTP